MKVLITGSHFTPAQAVIEQLQKQKSVKIVYVGRFYTREGDKSPSVESQILPKMGVKFINLTTGRLQRFFTRYTVPSLLKIPIGFVQAFYILLVEKPDVILSFGGYIAVPIVISAWLLSIPIIIHEQTLISGLANKICSYFADKIAISFPEHEFSKISKTILTGNPIRKELLAPCSLTSDYQKLINEAKNKKKPLILVMGGNQGSHTLNQVIADLLPGLTQDFLLIHQTGDSKFKDFEKLASQKDNLVFPQHYLVTKWIDSRDLGGVLPHIDLVISRAGMNSLLEYAYFGVPSLLVPIPSHKEQALNTSFFKKLGLAESLSQSNLQPAVLLDKIKQMIKDLPRLKKNTEQAKSIVTLDAAQRLALETLLLASKTNRSV